MTNHRDPRPEHLLVDGYNLIKADPLLRHREQTSLEAARLSLEQRLRAYAGRTGGRITLFFDGDEGLGLFPDSRKEGPLQILFSRPPEKADDLLKRAIQQQHGARRVRLITSDREIRRFAQRHKIRATTSAEFVEELASRPQPLPTAAAPAPPELDPDLTLTPDEVDAWERLFQRGKREE